MISFWVLTGWLAIVLGLLVGPPQLAKIWKYKKGGDVSKMTYFVLVIYQITLISRAIYIEDWVFIVTTALGLAVNLLILILLFWFGRGD